MIKVEILNKNPYQSFPRFHRIDETRKPRSYKLPSLDFGPKEVKISSNKVRLNY